MKLRCKTCKKSFPRPARGRKPIYCSAACRQKAYRKRVADPFGRLKAAIKSDLYAIRDRDARIRAAVKVLEEAGFEVFLERATARRKGPKPNLRIVTDKDEDPSSA